jgi:membrane protease YdiL (CAAX protease family)
LTARPVPWTLQDCLWASLPAAVLFARRFTGRSPLVALAGHPWAIVAAWLATAAIWVVPVYIVAIRKRGGRAADLGLVGAPAGPSARLIGSGFLIMLGVNVFWGLIVTRFGLALQPDLLNMFGAGWERLVLALMMGAVIAPIAEEIFFRGFLFAALRNNYSFVVAASISALIFGVGHMVPSAIVPLSALGFLFAWLRERTGSIWPSIAMHMMVNGFYFIVRFAANQLSSSQK